MCRYLSDARSKAALTSEDLSSALTALLEKTPSQSITQTIGDTVDYVLKSDDYIPDEHVIAVWIDEKDNALSWFLGVVSTVTKDAIGVTYYNPKDRERCTWTLDDTVDEIPTPKDNVIYRNVTVGYSGSRVVRCTIDKETVASINRSFADYLQTL